MLVSPVVGYHCCCVDFRHAVAGYALVTGGNRGIGLEVCRKLVQRGKPVLLTARSAEAAQQAAQQLRAAGGSVEVQAFALGASDADSINALVKSCSSSTTRRLTLLVRLSVAPTANSPATALHTVCSCSR